MVVVKQSSRHKMWTEITRRKYEQEGQRYASDLTDAEWAVIAPHMAAVKRLGRPRETELRTCSMRSCISRGPAVSGECCRRTFLRSQPCKAISTTGGTTACSRRSILSCCCKRAKRRGAERGRQRGGFGSNTAQRPDTGG